MRPTSVQRRSWPRRDFASSKCARHVGEMQKRRVEKRAQGLTKRNSSVTITTESPYYPTIQNETCILTPEATTGPYIWEVSQTLRQDMTEGQSGIPLVMVCSASIDIRDIFAENFDLGHRSDRHQHLRAYAKRACRPLALQCHGFIFLVYQALPQYAFRRAARAVELYHR